MISRVLYWRSLWRSLTRDKIFLALVAIAGLTFVAALTKRDPATERTAVPFDLALTFLVVNLLFAALTLRREPLLAYLFLAMTVILNLTLFFFFRYLELTLQAGQL